MATNYERGAEFERRVVKALSADGYECFRAAGSRGKADVVAIKPGQVLLIQCKRNGDIEREEWNAVWALSSRLQPYNNVRRVVIPLVAYMPGKRGIAYKRIEAPSGHGERRCWTPWTPEMM